MIHQKENRIILNISLNRDMCLNLMSNEHFPTIKMYKYKKKNFLNKKDTEKPYFWVYY